MNKYISDSRGILAIPLMAMFSSPVVPNIADVLSEKNGGIVIEDEVDKDIHGLIDEFEISLIIKYDRNSI